MPCAELWSMSNPSSPSSSSAQYQETLHQQEVANEDAGIVVPGAASDDAELSPPRCEWEFRLAATVPSTSLPGASDAIGSVDFDPTGRLLATGGIARRIRMYSVASLLDSSAAASGAGPAACICVPAKLSSVRWRPGALAGTVVGCGDYDGVVTEYDVERGMASWERDEHAGRRVWALDYAPGATMAVSGSDDRTAHVWDPRAPSAGWATARAGGAVLCVEFDPSGGPHLAVGSADRRAVVYDVRALGRGAVAWMDGHGRAVTYVRWAGRRVVTSAADGTHRLWEWGGHDGEAREVRSYSGHASARSFVGMGLWRGAGLVASGSESNHVFVYDLRWDKPIWVQPFWGAQLPAISTVDADVGGGGGGGFVSAVAWRQGGDGDLDDGALVAGGSDGALKMFTCQRRKAEEAAGDVDY
ncbi:WD repeat-containing protein RUP2-like [Phragmites australis]|uniref:WD repeat-containing protein RUP2-like n=1 Tax=Phragmites australis TaxID=29695 RepID=UPI002D79CAF8|nr:WD repeat-containing protein RUP2-like [Phragmites australis]